MKRYLIHVMGVEGVTRGPYRNEKLRGAAAKDLHASDNFDPCEDILLALDIDMDGVKINTWSYGSSFFEEEV
jgi:hypothetical protein